MERSHSLALVLLSLGLALPPAQGLADTLVLRDGDQIEGELISVADDTIEFRQRGRVRRFDRSDVRRIDLDDPRGGRSRDRDRERSGDRDRDRSEDRDRSADVEVGKAGGSRRSGLREHEVIVAANVPWTETRIEVRAGQTIYVSSSGRIAWGPDRRDDAGGESGNHRNPNRPLPNRPGAALIGKVGLSSRDYFFIGNNEGPITMRASGPLYLGVNDDYLQDNSGSFRVMVQY